MTIRSLPKSAPPLDAVQLRRRLLVWYARHRREMPWRATRDPYPVWLSEVMLQQTQVATATPYFQSFLARFPSIDALARARPSDVLAAWAGLGYYRRARHLHEASRVVMREHGGRVPGSPEAFRRLPGVGRYTMGAVLSIAFDRPLPVLDGNVARVLSRLAALAVSIRDPLGAKALWALAATLVPMRGAGDWNQALMELGAMVCTPRTPRCAECPVRAQCRAYALGRVADFPPVPARRAGERVRRAVARIEWRGRLLVTRQAGPLLTGLWEPPGVTLGARERPGRPLAAELARLGLSVTLERTSSVVRHTVTHRRIEVEIWRGTLATAPPRTAGLRAVDMTRPGVALTALATRVAGLTNAG